MADAVLPIEPRKHFPEYMQHLETIVPYIQPPGGP